VRNLSARFSFRVVACPCLPKQNWPCRDGEGGNTPDDGSQPGEKDGSKSGGEPDAKKRKIFPNDPYGVESDEAAPYDSAVPLHAGALRRLQVLTMSATSPYQAYAMQ
jgi:hypothetical protein